MEKEIGYPTFIGSFRKVYATIPEQLFIKLQDSGILKTGKFDDLIAQAIYEKLVSIGVMDDTGSAKKIPKKKFVAGGEAE